MIIMSSRLVALYFQCTKVQGCSCHSQSESYMQATPLWQWSCSCLARSWLPWSRRLFYLSKGNCHPFL